MSTYLKWLTHTTDGVEVEHAAWAQYGEFSLNEQMKKWNGWWLIIMKIMLQNQNLQ